MSRGHGRVQRLILSSLKASTDTETVPPLTWFTRAGLGLMDVPRPSFSRAAVQLQREGLLDRALLWEQGPPSTNPYYRHARTVIHPDDQYEWYQGARFRLLVRLAENEQRLAEWQEARDRLSMMNHRSPMWRNYQSWLVAGDVEGAQPHDTDSDSPIYPLSPASSQAEVRELIARSRGQRLW